MKKIVLLALLLKLTTLLCTACGSPDKESKGTPALVGSTPAPTLTSAPTDSPQPTAKKSLDPTATKTPTPARQPAETLLEFAFYELEKVSSYHAKTNMLVTNSYQDTQTIDRTYYDFTHQPPDRAQGVTLDADQRFRQQELILVGDDIYLKDADSDGWRLDYASHSLLTNTMLFWLTDVEELVDLGEDSVDGMPAFHLQGRKTNVDEILGAFVPGEIDSDEPGDVKADYQVDYWINSEDGRFIKILIVGDMSIPVKMTESSRNAIEVVMSWEIESDTLFSNYDEVIHIEPPTLLLGGPENAESVVVAWLNAFPPDAPTFQLRADGSGDYPDLASAVLSVDPGSILMLEEGSYQLDQPLEINKPIGLVGAGSDLTEIVSSAAEFVIRYSGDGPFSLEDIALNYQGDKVADVMVVMGGEITFVRCSFSGAVSDQAADEWHAGLKMLGDTKGLLQACSVSGNNGDGIWIDNEAEPTVADSYLAFNEGAGIYVGGHAKPTLDRNDCSDNIFGISFAGEAVGVARDNNCQRNQEGIAIGDQASPFLESNTCVGNSFAGIAYSDFASGKASQNECTGNDVGIEVSGSATPTLEENVCSDNHVGIKVLEGAGIDLEGAAEPLLVGNECLNNEESGIKYLDGTGGIARENRCSDNGGPGIFVAEWSQPTLELNTCNGNTSGVHYASETGGVARDNDFSGNDYFGIEVGLTSQPILENNDCSRNGLAGIGYFETSAGIARGNLCTDNGMGGIFVSNQAHPELEGNVANDNGQVGIYFVDEAMGIARLNECAGNLIGLYILPSADPMLEDNDCHDNSEADLLDDRP